MDKLSSLDDKPQMSSNQQQKWATDNDWPRYIINKKRKFLLIYSYFRSTDNQQQQNTMDSSGLIYLIATHGESNGTDNTNDELIVNIRTDDQTSEQTSEQLLDENLLQDQQKQLPLIPS